jgi:hypothetical protein
MVIQYRRAITNMKVLEDMYIVTCRPVAGQRLGKHIPATTNTQATIG